MAKNCGKKTIFKNKLRIGKKSKCLMVVIIMITTALTIVVIPNSPIVQYGQAPPPGGQWIVVDQHVHSSESGDPTATQTIHTIADYAEGYGLDAMVITNHADMEYNQGTTETITSTLFTENSCPDHPNIQLMRGIEWNCPGIIYSPASLDHCGVYFPSMTKQQFNEKITTFIESYDEQIAGVSSDTDKAFYFLDDLGAVAFLNHPSRGTEFTYESIRTWAVQHPSLYGMEGSPGHQKTLSPYPHHRYDEKVAIIGGDWDLLLSDGIRFWIVAGSDFHGLIDDYWPGEFSKTYIHTTDNSWNNVLEGYKKGCMYTALDNVIDELDFRIVDDADPSNIAYIGETLEPTGSSVTVKIQIHSEKILHHVDIIWNYIGDPSSTVQTTRYDSGDWTRSGPSGDYTYILDDYPFSGVTNFKPFYVRIRGADEDDGPTHDPKYFYSNPIFVGGTSTSKTFNMVCQERYQDVSSTLNVAEHVLKFDNFLDKPNTILLWADIPKELRDAGWSAEILPNNKIVLGNEVRDVATHSLSVTVPSDWPEDEPAGMIYVRAKSVLSEHVESVPTYTVMNNYEVFMECKDPYQFILSGGTVDYTIFVSHVGRASIDVIDLDYSPKDWQVDFYEANGITPLPTNNGDPNLPDTGTLHRTPEEGPGKIIVARVTDTGGAQKYHQESIQIIGISAGDTNEKFHLPTNSTTVGMVFCVGDDNNCGNDKYYKPGSFTGHNVNPGTATKYAIHVFGVPGISGDVQLIYNIESSPPGWTISPGTSVPAPAVGESTTVYLTVTAPPDASVGDTCVVKITGQAPGVPDDFAYTTTKVVKTKKVYIVNYDGLNQEYMDLSGLMPNTVSLASTGSSYTGATDYLVAVTDANHCSILTSAAPGSTGVWGVGATYIGRDDTTKIIKTRRYNYNDVQVQSIYDPLKTTNSELRTAFTTGKNWVSLLFAGPNCDIISHGREHPYYIGESPAYWLGDPAHGAVRLGFDFGGPFGVVGFDVEKEAPSDAYVMDSSKKIIDNEDPDLMYILLANSDDGGHLYGGVSDDTKDDEINQMVNREAMLDVVEEADTQLGELITYLNNRGTLDDSIIVVTSDHGTSTMYQPYQEDVDPVTSDRVIIHRPMDFKEILEDYEIMEMRDYEWLASLLNFVGIFGVDPAKQTEVENILLNLKCKATYIEGPNIGEEIVWDPNPVWDVFDRTEVGGYIPMRDKINSYNNRPYELYNELQAKGKIDIKLPDVMVFMNQHYLCSGYGDAIMGTMNWFGAEVPWLPPSFKLDTGPGAHGTWSEQHVPLILHGPGVKQGYQNTDPIDGGGPTILDIVPTICRINGWPLPDGAEGAVLDCVLTVHNIDQNNWYANIQDAIDDAFAGNTIYAYPSTYNEDITIHKSVILIGADSTSTIIHGSGSDDVVSITADNVEICGFEIRNSGTNFKGIYCDMVSDVYIHNNVISNNYDGVYASGSSEQNIRILGNDIEDNSRYGIYLDWPTNCYIYGNNLINNGQNADDRTQGNFWYSEFYPTGGNYWSDYSGADNYDGGKTSFNQPQSGGSPDGIIDQSKDVDGGSLDYGDWYPMVSEAQYYTFDPELVADSNGNLHSVWWDSLNQINYGRNIMEDGKLSGRVLDWGEHPSIAIDPSDNNIIYILYSKKISASGIYELYCAQSTDRGSSWTPPMKVDRGMGAQDALNPRIVIDNAQHVHIVWEENRDGNDFEIFSMDKLDSATERAVTTDNVDSRQPDLACEVTDTENDGGYSVHVVWQSLDAGGKTNIYHREGTIDGASGVVTWINPVTLVDDPNSNAKDPAVAVDCYENVNVVWADDRDGGWSIYLHVGWLGSGTHGNRGWSSSEPSGPPKGPDSSPLFPISDVAGYDASSPDLVTSFYHVTWNHIDIVWHDNRPQGVETDYEIYYQRVDTCSNAWVCGWNGQDNKISDDAIDSMTPSIAVTPTGLHTVWADDIIYQNIGNLIPVVHPCLQSLPDVVWDTQICVVGYAPPGPGNCRAVQLYLNGQQYGDPVYPSQSPDDCGVFIVYNVPLNIGLNTITATSIDLNLGYESEQAPIQTVEYITGRIAPGIFFDHAQYLQGISMVVSDYPNISPFGTIVLYTVYGTDTYTPTGQITIGIAGEVITLDPAMAIDIESRNAVTQIYNGLYDVDYDGMLVPCLATDHFLSPDGKDYTFTLRPDVKFHDNSDFDAYDVKYTFERILGLTSEELNSPYWPNYDLIKSINVIDNRTIEFHLSEPSPSFLSYMTMSIIPYNYTESGGNFYDNPVGTGPFKFDVWESPTNIQFTKFEDHFNGLPKLDDVIFSTISDDILRVTALLYGEVDLIERVSPSSTSLIDGSPNAEMRTSDYTDLVSIGLQNNVITLDQSLEREALNYAINRDATHSIYDSWAKPSEGIIPPKSWAYNHEQDDGFEHDTEKAIELLMAAGWYDIDQDGILEGENGEEFYITLKYLALDIEAEQIANIVTENLSEIGIRVLKQPLDWLTYNYNLITKDFEMMIFFEPNLIAIDPDYMYSMFHSSAIPNGTNNGFNFVSYQSGCVDELLESARITTDPDTRITLYQDAGDEIVHGGKVKGI